MNPCDNLEALLRTLSPPRRNAYFYGKRMDVQHFQLEQDYGKHKQWLLNRLTLGKGVLCGLKVGVDDGRLCVDPGVAIDGLGREVVVPVRQCIDPTTQEGGCCAPCCGDAAEGEAPPPRDDASGVFTLWVCYRECKTDFQPVMTNDCGSRESCAAGTLVETFCLKVTPGSPDLLQDPAWCAQLWPRDTTVPGPTPAPPPLNHMAAAASVAAAAGTHVPTREELFASLNSRRRILCGLLGEDCAPDEVDACVPLGIFSLRAGRVIAFDACFVRPRVYSNAVLLDLILCLADKIDACCGDHDTPAPQPPAPEPEPPAPEPQPPAPEPPAPEPPPTMRVRSVEFLGGANLDVIATVDSPLDPTRVPIRRQGTAIRIRFTRPLFTAAAHAPSTAVLNDPDWKRANVLVAPPATRNGLDYVPGSLTVETPDTLLWRLNPETPFYGNSYRGWQKGELVLRLFGQPDPSVPRTSLADTGGRPLDGEPTVLTDGAISGNNTPGGNFTLHFVVG